jgi:hypothetical protein
MNLWTAIKRFDKRSDEWARAAVERTIAHLDRPQDRAAQPGKKHLAIWDLLARGLSAGKKSGR